MDRNNNPINCYPHEMRKKIPFDSIIRDSLMEASRSKDVVTPEDIVTVAITNKALA